MLSILPLRMLTFNTHKFIFQRSICSVIKNKQDLPEQYQFLLSHPDLGFLIFNFFTFPPAQQCIEKHATRCNLLEDAFLYISTSILSDNF